jgi:hypothetical protein
MSRFLEAVFVLGCSLVGFGLSAGEGNAVQKTLQYSVQLVNESVAEAIRAARPPSVSNATDRMLATIRLLVSGRRL